MLTGPRAVEIFEKNWKQYPRIYMTDSVIEATDYSGRHLCIETPPQWRRFFAQLCAANEKANKSRSSAFSHEHEGVRYRVLLANTLRGSGLSLRKINNVIPDLETDLRLPWRLIYPIIQGTGLTIFAGPMGSGKSTTMVSALHKLDVTERGRLGTIEDPIEYIFPGPFCIQRELHTHSDSVASALKDVVMMDCTTIMWGEIRDPESAVAAVQLGATGHSVVGTLHADSAVDVLTRMMALLDEKYIRLLPRTLRGCWWQKVLRFGDEARQPVAVYESFQVNTPVQRILEAGPDKFHHIFRELENQGRLSAGDYANQLVRDGRLTRQEAAEFQVS